MAERTEPSILEYARFHGIATSALASSELRDYVSSDSLEDLEAGLRDPESRLGNFEATISDVHTQVKSRQNERLEIGRDAAIFLSSIIKPVAAPPSLDTSSEFNQNRHRVKSLKMEPPILKTDHELDLRAFSGGIISLDPTKLNLPLEKLQEENDEGMSWPKYYLDLPMQMWERVKAEKLDCTREVLLFIQGVRSVEKVCTERFYGDMLSEGRNRVKVMYMPCYVPVRVVESC